MNYLFYDEAITYPNHIYNYSPSIRYAEYPRNDIALEENKVYDAIRKIFMDVGYDRERYGTESWNPLGSNGAGIRSGDIVLIKPNWVLHRNLLSGQEDSLDCLVTHPSVLRCVLDYTILALEGKGTVYIGDSPVKGCKLRQLWKNHHYDCIKDYYKDYDVRWVDLRGPGEEKDVESSLSGITVNVGGNSYFYNYKKQSGLRIPNYNYHNVIRHHEGDIQEYCVNELAIRADVIINLPKPKSHRKSGFTGAMKNFVGINYDKEYLPHHTVGDRGNGGDEFYQQTFIKKMASFFFEKRDIRRTAINRKDYSNDLIYKTLDKLYSAFNERIDTGRDMDTITQGTWYGNDTLWRTVLDLNMVVHLANRNGILEQKPVRKIFSICDMVVSGEKEGPLSPSLKEEHVILFGENVVEVDAIIARLMHFRIQMLQSINVALRDGLLGAHQYEDITLLSNVNKYNGIKLEKADFAEFKPFIAATGWAGYINE